MFFWKYKEKIMEQEFRIRELEEKLCPYEKHDWVLVRTESNIDSYGLTIDTIYICKCGRCGKVIESNWPIYFKPKFYSNADERINGQEDRSNKNVY